MCISLSGRRFDQPVEHVSKIARFLNRHPILQSLARVVPPVEAKHWNAHYFAIAAAIANSQAPNLFIKIVLTAHGGLMDTFFHQAMCLQRHGDW
jgi:hypothetical protein